SQSHGNGKNGHGLGQRDSDESTQVRYDSWRTSLSAEQREARPHSSTSSVARWNSDRGGTPPHRRRGFRGIQAHQRSGKRAERLRGGGKRHSFAGSTFSVCDQRR